MVSMQIVSEVYALTMCGYTNDLKHRSLQLVTCLCYPPLTIPMLVGVYHRLWSPSLYVCMRAMSEMCALSLCNDNNDLKFYCMQYVM